ncbi:cocaine- and amphetamine-regulated transcript protein [Ictalurus punctatus]|uniref:Cocaine- and amphetamine-regulated transcript protein n=1 Tax=Ictalurus punctatus TaxID=7998 RepID=A0A2D0RA83_ICTPU|nr:cocaine- and amphetamine-regulated transcript protein [Ictalurus punctatus]
MGQNEYFITWHQGGYKKSQRWSTRSINTIFITMTKVCLVLISVTCCLSAVLSCCDESLDQRSVHTAIIKTQQEKDLIEALQEVLQKLQNKQLPNTTKKFGQLPSCDAGEPCAARKGARVGKLCGCPPGTTCDFFIMKCL